MAGIGGKFCKHISAVERYFPGSISINRMTTAPERYQVALLAVGSEEVADPQFFGCSEHEAAQLKRASHNSLTGYTEIRRTSAEDAQESGVDVAGSGDDLEDQLSYKHAVALVEAVAHQW